jgi:hypothetical protein
MLEKEIVRPLFEEKLVKNYYLKRRLLKIVVN